MIQTQNGRPGVDPRAAAYTNRNSAPILPPEPVEHYATPDLADMTPHGQTIALEWYGLGVRDGHTRGYQAALDDMAALQRRQVQIARAAAQAGPYSDLAERRGDHERAERARHHEQRIAQMPSPTEVGGWQR